MTYMPKPVILLRGVVFAANTLALKTLLAGSETQVFGLDETLLL
jgi:hypothetical protein